MSSSTLRSRTNSSRPTSRHEALDSTAQSLGTDNLPDASGTAYKAFSVTPQDTVIETSDGHRLPGVPKNEAQRLNALRNGADEREATNGDAAPKLRNEESEEGAGAANIEIAPAFTDPLFPPLPVYGPATFLRRLQCGVFRCTSGVLSLCFLSVVVFGAIAESLPPFSIRVWKRLHGKNPDEERPFYKIEEERKLARAEEVRRWTRRGSDEEEGISDAEGRIRKDGGKDKLLNDIAYYAHRVGLEAETHDVVTEDGFILELIHIWDPADPPYYEQPNGEDGEAYGQGEGKDGLVGKGGKLRPIVGYQKGRRRYPVFLIHGLLQSAGAFCCNDDDSLAFWLTKSGYDVWLGNNRCGFSPRHTALHKSDPRMWAWNIRQMGILDLPAFITPILSLASTPKLALIAHSQGTTETFVALARQQRPHLGTQISVFCALAPAVYAGTLINKFYFKFMRIIPPSAFRIVFGIHAFIPFMVTMNRWIPGWLYGSLGYRVFWFLFGWTDTRWDRGIRSRFFQFSPVYVSAETMRWWLGRECFARHRCILATREEEGDASALAPPKPKRVVHGVVGKKNPTPSLRKQEEEENENGAGPWYDENFPPLAMWVGGGDQLVDGKRLIRRFEEGREPCVDVLRKVVCEEYEHLDPIWAVDAPERVFKGVRDVVWETVPESVRDGVVVPVGVGKREEEEG